MNNESTLIQAPCGQLSGIRAEGYRKYLGIPFAKPPVGERAFRAPQALEPWEGLFCADTPGKNPIQSTPQYSPDEYDEDCLYLNVWVPDHEGSEKLPVMVYIFGGSYSQGGSGIGPMPSGTLENNVGAARYDMEKFCRETGCIMVTINYRLNLYGFLNLHFLDARYETNLGLRDQILALRWIQENISAFGGDAENVTLFGQSAGGACILALMSIPEAQPLFAKAIVQSACIDHFYTEQESEAVTKKYLELVGVGPANLDGVRSLPVETVMKANAQLEAYTMGRFDTRCAFSPLLDGELLADYPKKLAPRSGKPLLIGTVNTEATIFIKDLSKPILKLFSWKVGLHDRQYPGKLRDRCGKALTDFMYKRPLSELLEVADHQKAWVYNFRFTTPSLESSGLYSCHTVELPLLFDYYKNNSWYDGQWDRAEKTAKKLRSYWGNFATFGNPSPQKAVWPMYGAKKQVFPITE